MINIIKFKKANCKNCYKCIRSCPVKAISFNNDQAQVIEDNCILCGNCLKVCTQNAKNVADEIGKVKEFIEKSIVFMQALHLPSPLHLNPIIHKRCFALEKLGFFI
ncbi:4Fe-4S dicluster domain-containing protein [Caloramator sp. Dgby_cultured_2]|uniref:4Fe-4S dicluster domain-containing protein n=1 Tax=Caloramator sp. Dgby_cultured_2 TaxID=3029174 RepID=UPI00237DBA5A|nr:4Fe-4S binding protein [Caloramator sp. Dgby_cultured_2]WDU83253.1 4Fe-4S binding protein [Caloramator sp. Dgby_cultured_2]